MVKVLMFCPECKAEYLEGVKRCSDCDVDLVASLPEPGRHSDGLASDDQLRGVWGGESQEEFDSICAQLKAAAIPFRVNLRGREFLTGLGQYFEIGVASDDYERGRDIVGRDFSDISDDSDEPSVVELPAEDDDATAVELDRSWDPEDWFPEDATVEIWSGDGEERASMIESALRENNIHARTELAGAGSGKVFVMPDDQSRAREIVREIEEAAPPK